MNFYAIHIGRQPGIYRSWTDARSQIHEFPGAIYQKFINENDAKYFVEHGKSPPVQTIKKQSNSGYGKNTLMGFIKSLPSQPLIESTMSPRMKRKNVIGSFISSCNKQEPVGIDPAIFAEYTTDNNTSSATTQSEDDIARAMRKYYTSAVSSSDVLYIYTDGSTHNNGSKHATGGFGVFYSDPTIPQISKRLPSSEKITNNIAEFQGIIHGIRGVPDNISKNKKIVLYTDSESCFLALTERYQKWVKNNWKSYYKGKTTNVKNKELIITAYKLITHHNVIIRWTRAHTGNDDIHSIGNDIADKLADC